MKNIFEKYSKDIILLSYSLLLLFALSSLTLFVITPIAFLGFFFTLSYILFLPGFFFMVLFFEKEKVDFIELFTLSIGLSIVFVTLLSLLYILLTPLQYTYFALLMLASITIGVQILVKMSLVKYHSYSNKSTNNYKL